MLMFHENALTMRFASTRNIPDGQPGQRAFPYKLYALLEAAEIDGFAHIISWQPGGKSFRVHQPELFTTSILPQCFKQSKYKSFLRQLNIYDFHRIQHGENKDGYCHRFLIRGQPDLCDLVVRVFVPSKKKRTKQRRFGALNPSSILCKDEDYTLAPQHGLGHQLTVKYQNHSFASSSHPTVSASQSIFPPETRENSSDAWLSFLEDNDAANALLADLDPALDNRIFTPKEDHQAMRDGNVDSRGPQVTDVNTGNNDFFADRQFLSRTLPIRTLVRTESEQSLASCGSTASSILGSLPSFQGSTVNGNTLPHNAVPQDVDASCVDLFVTGSLEEQIPWLQGCQETSRSVLKMNPKNVPSELPSWHLDSMASPCVSSKSSCFPTTIEQGDLNREGGVWFASTREPLDDWHELTPARDALSRLDSTDSSVIMIKNEDLTRSESVFPSKLHRMLQDADREGFHHIVSWIQGGTAFKVHDVESFMRHVMTKYFDQSKFQSFRRQLNLYQFTRVNSDVHGTYYFHKCFLQCDPSLCLQITRPKTSRRSEQK